MCGHTRRFNPSHQWVHKRIVAGEFNIQQMDVQTYFFRRTNMNALGQPRSWTDHLLWHHAAHTVDLFAYQTRQPDREGQRDPGPDPPDARHRDGHDIQLKAANGAICTLRCRSTTTGRSAPSSATSATPAPTSRATTTSFNGKEEKIDVSQGRRVDERHRAAGPRVLRRDPRRPRAQRQRRAGAALLRGAAPARAAAARERRWHRLADI